MLSIQEIQPKDALLKSILLITIFSKRSLHNGLDAGYGKPHSSMLYQSNYYDQSYFIKSYNRMTGENPRSFFRAIQPMAGKRLIFQFVKEVLW